jgi:hypothetical protein
MVEDTVNNLKLQARRKGSCTKQRVRSYLQRTRFFLRILQFRTWSINSPHVEEPKFLITVFTTARHFPLFWVTVTQSTPLHPTSLILILTLSSHLRSGLSSAHFPASFTIKSSTWIYSSPTCHVTSPSHPYFIARISCKFLHLALKYLPQRPILELPQPGSFPYM